MTLQDFIDKYSGKFVEAGGSSNALNQCVDLANQYLKEVWNQPIILWTNAVDFPLKLTDKYIFIENTPDGVPLPGDVVVFKKYGSLYGTPGHIAIVKKADVKQMIIFEQNYPTGSTCKLGTHNYLGCVGWFRLKSTQGSMSNELQECLAQHKKLVDELEGVKKKLNEANAEIDNQKTIAIQRKKDYENLIEELAKRLTLPATSDKNDVIGSVERLLKVEDQLTKAQKKLYAQEQEFSDQKSEMQHQIEQLRIEVERQQKQNETLLSRLDSLETQLKQHQEAVELTNRFKSFVSSILKIFERKNAK